MVSGALLQNCCCQMLSVTINIIKGVSGHAGSPRFYKENICRIHPKTIGSPRIHPGSTPGSTLTSDVKELAVTWKCAPTNWPAQRTDLTSHRAVHRRTNPTERTTERAHEDRPTDRLVDGQTESRTDAFSHTHNLCCNDVGRSKPNCRSGYCLAPCSCPLSRRQFCYVFVSQALLLDGASATCSCSMPVHKKGPRGRQAAMRHWFALTRVAGAAAAADTPPARPAAPDRPPNPVP